MNGRMSPIITWATASGSNGTADFVDECIARFYLGAFLLAMVAILCICRLVIRITHAKW